MTPYPVRLGTTYLDAGPVEKPGEVIEFIRPRNIGFRHTVIIRRGLLRTDIDARIRYSLRRKPTERLWSGDSISNEFLRGLIKLATPVILNRFARRICARWRS